MSRIWLRHTETGGYFDCPAEAAGDWAQLGWAPAAEPPAEPNPVVAERIAWEQAQEAATTTPAPSGDPQGVSNGG